MNEQAEIYFSENGRILSDPIVEAKKIYRPFENTDELIAEFKRRFNVNCPDYAMPLIWVSPKGRFVEQKELIFGFSSNGMVSFHGSIVNMKSLLDGYTFLDGSPCGMEE